MNNHVYGAVVQQEFAALETLGQFLPDGLFNDIRAGKTGPRLGLGDIDITQQCQRGGDATINRVGHHRHIGHALQPQALDDRAGLGHLHQGDEGFLHTGAAGGRKTDQGNSLLERQLGRPGELFADGIAHGAAVKIEFKGHYHQRQPLHLAGRGNQRIFFAGGSLRRGQAIAIALFVLEFEAVNRFNVGQDFLPALGIEKNIEAAAGADAHVVVALGADVVIALHVRPVQDRVALDAFFPQALGHVGALFTLVTAYAGGQNLVYPTHGKPRSQEAIIINALWGN